MAEGDNGTYWVGGNGTPVIALCPPGGDEYTILADGLDRGSSDLRTQDADLPGMDGTRFGRDYLTGPTFQFTVMAQPADGDTESSVARLAALWHDRELRTSPGRVIPIRYVRNGQMYTVWGRPRKFAADAGTYDTFEDGFAIINLEFKLDTAFAGVGAERSETLGLLRPVSDGGLILPADVPFDLSPGSESSQARDGVFTVAGSVPAPFTLEIKGPVTGSVSDAIVTGDGWRVHVTKPIAWDQKFKLDTRTMLATINGASRPGVLSASTRVTGRLTPGRQSFTFSGNDTTGSARATLRWYDTITI